MTSPCPIFRRYSLYHPSKEERSTLHREIGAHAKAVLPTFRGRLAPQDLPGGLLRRGSRAVRPRRPALGPDGPLANVRRRQRRWEQRGGSHDENMQRERERSCGGSRCARRRGSRNVRRRRRCAPPPSPSVARTQATGPGLQCCAAAGACCTSEKVAGCTPRRRAASERRVLCGGRWCWHHRRCVARWLFHAPRACASCLPTRGVVRLGEPGGGGAKRRRRQTDDEKKAAYARKLQKQKDARAAKRPSPEERKEAYAERERERHRRRRAATAAHERAARGEPLPEDGTLVVAAATPGQLAHAERERARLAKRWQGRLDARDRAGRGRV